MAIHLRGPKKYFLGYHLLTRAKEKNPTGMELGILVLPKGKRHKIFYPKQESVFLLLSGKGVFRSVDIAQEVVRKNFFKEEPCTLSLPRDCPAVIVAQSRMELVVVKTKNTKVFLPRIFKPKEVRREWRGKGIINNTSLRLVRTVFDKSNHPKSNLVIGEVVNLPGRWSSYPPHHHPQPEIYYYRFEPKQGYGFAQLGNKAIKVGQDSLIKILNNVDHPQAAAPGYQMWYLWVIRHLKDKPYIIPTNNPKHKWVLKSRKRK